MRIQVFGPFGMLGSAVVRAATRRGHMVEERGDMLESVTPKRIRAETVINCAGLVKQRQVPASRMMLVNAIGPHQLAEACDAVSARLIHISTDCVFDGRGPHAEWDAPDATDEYARSKMAGEILRHPHLTIRTSFVGFGQWGLIAELLRDQPTRASARLLWSGHTVDTIADVLITMAEQIGIYGLLHVPGEFQTRWGLCEKLVRRYGLPAQVIRDDEYEADRRLVSDYWDGWGLPELPPFDAQLETMERPGSWNR